MNLLWGKSAGLCAFPDCRLKLTSTNRITEDGYLIGEMAHICGSKEGANRYNPKMTDAERDDYENLVLLCPTHHTVIDKDENESRFSAQSLLDLKSKHEEYVERIFLNSSFESVVDVARYLLPVFSENLDALENFGPNSIIAKSNPQSDAYEIWSTERIATILPNNKLILSTLMTNRQLFGREFSALFARYRSHVVSYEQWVLENISYEGVVPFPETLPAKLEELCDASKSK